MVRELERAMYAAEKDLTNGKGGLLKFELLKIGTSVARADAPVSKSDNLGGIEVELVTSDNRDIRTSDFYSSLARESYPKTWDKYFYNQGSLKAAHPDVILTYAFLVMT